MTNDIQTAVRLPSELIRRLDALAKRMTKERPGVKVTRAAVIRMLVMQGIERISE